MALRELPSIGAFSRLLVNSARANICAVQAQRQFASSAEAVAKQESTGRDELGDLESQSSFTSSGSESDKIAQYDPVRTSKKRQGRLPPSRYQFKPPRYYRGPLHPHQPPPKSDPISREFVPGPFNHTRLEYTYQSTIAPDLMTLAYSHKPPGHVESIKSERLRTWDDSSPYHKGRPKRGPRGPGSELPIIEKDIDWQNIPRIEEVTVHTMVKGAIEDSAYLHTAGILLQAITGVRPTVHKAKHSVANFGIREGKAIALSCNIRGDAAYEFVDKCINLVMPRIKDFPGIKGSTGDSSGNIGFGFDKEGTILFPEVSVNYDSYPAKMIPGFHVVIKTTATSDRHARLLMKALGMPFYGKLVD